VQIRRRAVAIDGGRNYLKASANQLATFTRFSLNGGIRRAAIRFLGEEHGVGGGAARRGTGGLAKIIDFIEGQESDTLLVRRSMRFNRNTSDHGTGVTNISIDVDLESSARRFRFAKTSRTDLIGTRTWIGRITGWLLSGSACTRKALKVRRTLYSVTAGATGKATGSTLIRIGSRSGALFRSGTLETIRTISVCGTATV